jgi:hypothetical protein
LRNELLHERRVIEPEIDRLVARGPTQSVDRVEALDARAAAADVRLARRPGKRKPSAASAACDG